MWKRENFLFLFAALGAAGGLVKVLEYFNIAPADWGRVLSNPLPHVSSLLWAIVLFMFSIGLSAYGLYVSYKRYRVRGGHPDQPATVIGTEGPLHGIIGDLVDITIEDAQYGDDPYYKPALKGLLVALASKDSLRPDGAVSVGVNTIALIGEKEYLPGVYKHVKITFSAKLHESKALTIRPGYRLRLPARSW